MKKRKKQDFKDKLVLDTGPLIDYLCNEGIADIIEDKIIENPNVTNIIISPLTVAEIYYVLCRTKGEKFADEKTNILKTSTKVELEFRIREIAALYTCKRAISLADCYVLATAKINNAPAVFKDEQEILEEMNKNPFDVKIEILQ